MVAGSDIHAMRKSRGELGGLGVGDDSSEEFTVGLDSHLACIHVEGRVHLRHGERLHRRGVEAQGLQDLLARAGDLGDLLERPGAKGGEELGGPAPLADGERLVRADLREHGDVDVVDEGRQREERLVGLERRARVDELLEGLGAEVGVLVAGGHCLTALVPVSVSNCGTSRPE
jgi:hypothetical protein